MEGDGNIEVAMGRSLFTIASDGASISRRWVGTAGMSGYFTNALSYFANLGENEDLELLAGRTAYRADGSTLWDRTDLPDGFTGTGDFNSNGSPEIVHVASGAISVLDGATGTTLAGPQLAAGTGSGGPPTVADFDGDGVPEIGVAKADFYSVYEVDLGAGMLTEIWATPNHDLSSSLTGSTVFDFEGDGIAEVVYNDECFLWVYDGPTGSIRFAAPTASFTGTEASLVADVDGDGKAEMVMIANGTDPRSPEGWDCDVAPWNEPDGARPAWVPDEGQQTWRGIVVFRDSANAWVGTRPLWNQHSYSVSNVCDPGDNACMPAMSHGSIPDRRRANWSVPWLNNFRQNVQNEGLFDAPDATVVLSVDCFSVPVALVALVRNLGEAILTEGVEVGFHVDEGGTERELGRGTTTTALFPGQGTEVRLELPADVPAGSSIRARILVDPDAPAFRECFDDNNSDEAEVPTCGPS